MCLQCDDDEREERGWWAGRRKRGEAGAELSVVVEGLIEWMNVVWDG